MSSAPFEDDEWQRVKRATEVAGFDDPAGFIREATLRFVDETIDEDGALACPFDDCEAGPFATIRQRRGHLGRSHAQEFPEGDFWCGHCGYGPTTWQGVTAHYGARDHDGDAVRLDHAPEPDELLAPDDVPDHMNRALLEDLYAQHDGNITDMCRAHDFDVDYGRVRHYLLEFDIHESTPNGVGVADLDHRDPELLEDLYAEADGNISDLYRSHGFECSYTKLVKWLKKLDIHDPTDPPGRRHGKGGPDPAADEEADDMDDDPDPPDRPEPEFSPDQQAWVLNWGRWGPPGSGTYHVDEDCWMLHRSDSDREPWPLPTPIDELEADEDWSACGHCEPDDQATESDDGRIAAPTEPRSTNEDAPTETEVDTEPSPDPEPLPTTETVPSPDPDPKPGFDPAAVDDFADTNPPDWLDEATFYTAVDMADAVDELAAVLGWDAPIDRLDAMVDALEVDL